MEIELKRLQSSTEKLNSLLIKYKAELSEKSKSLDDAHHELANKHHELAKAHNQLANLEKKLAHVNHELDLSHTDIDEKMQTICDLELENQSLKANVARLSDVFAVMKVKVDMMERKRKRRVRRDKVEAIERLSPMNALIDTSNTEPEKLQRNQPDNNSVVEQQSTSSPTPETNEINKSDTNTMSIQKENRPDQSSAFEQIGTTDESLGDGSLLLNATDAEGERSDEVNNTASEQYYDANDESDVPVNGTGDGDWNTNELNDSNSTSMAHTENDPIGVTKLSMPRSKMELVIDRHGVSVSKLQQQFTVAIEMEKNSPVFIYGNETNRRLAEQFICNLEKSTNSLLDQGPNTHRHNDYFTDTMSVPKSKIGLLIGVNGWRVKYLKKNSGAKDVHISCDHSGPEASVAISGTPAAILKVKHLIEYLIAENCFPTATNIFLSHSSSEPISDVTTDQHSEVLLTMDRPTSTVEQPIDEMAFNLTRLSDGSSNNKSVSHDCCDRKTRASINDLNDYCQEAQLLLDKLLCSTSHHDKFPANSNVHELAMKVSKRDARLIVGSRGVTKHDLEGRSGARIDVGYATGDNTMVPVVIAGELDACERAKLLITELIAKV